MKESNSPIILVINLLLIVGVLLYNMMGLIDEKYNQQQIINTLNQQIIKIELEKEKLQSYINTMEDELNHYNQFDIDIAEITGYAPLDPNAVEGMCYSGDPSITASGANVVVGETIAGAKSIPFGTKVWIEGFGWREVQDRGGMITEGKFDIAVNTKKEAYQIGRREVLIVIERTN